MQAVEFAKEVGNRGIGVTVVLYGSFPRDDFDERSDVDLLILGQADESEVRQIATEVRKRLEGMGERTWGFSLLFAKSYEELDPSLKATIATEGLTLLGRPIVDTKGLEPHVLFQYDVSKLSGTDRKRFYRALKSTGLHGSRWGSTLMVPASRAKEAEDLLTEYRVVRRRARVLAKL